MKALRGLGCILALALVFYVGTDFEALYQGTQFFVFQTRDLHRAALVAAGQPIFFGPEVTGGGNLPGPFYYYLLALPLAFGGNWESAWWMMAALAFAAGLIGAAYLRARVSALSALVFFALFSTATLTRVFVRIFLNVSFLIAFAVAAMALIAESCVAQSPARRRNCFLAACLLLGFGAQLHFSVAIWLPALLYLHGFPLRREEVGVGRKVMAAGVLCFLAPMIPYFAWKALGAAGVQFGQAPFAGGAAGEIVPTYLHFLRNLAGFSARDIGLQFAKISEVLPFSLVPMLAIGGWPPAGERRGLARAMAVCAAFGFIPFGYYFVAPIGYRYGMAAYLPLIFLAAICFEELRVRPPKLRALAFSCVVILGGGLLLYLGLEKQRLGLGGLLMALAALAVVAPFAALATEEPRRAGRWMLASVLLMVAVQCLQRQYKDAGFLNQAYMPNKIMPNLRQWRSVWRKVHAVTGWSYQEASRRIFFVNHHLEQDGSPAYEATPLTEAEPPDSLPFPLGGPDGFFISLAPLMGEAPAAWLLRESIQPDIKAALRDGSLQVGRSLTGPDINLMPYWVVRESRVPRGFHDTGAGYLGGAVSAEPEGVLRLRWNSCPGRPPYCEAAATITLEKEEGGRWRARVVVEGAALSQVSPWINPEWTENLQKPYLELACRGRREQFQLASSIGYNRRNGVSRENFPFNYNNSFVAPFTREFYFACAHRPDAAAFGSEGGEADRVRDVLPLPPFRLEGRP